MVGVYKIINQTTGDFYIGKSKNIKKRMYNHRYPGIHSEKFEEDIRKYGWNNFSFEIIEECSLEDLHEREAYYIKTLEPVYNTIVRGRERSPETKEKIRASATGRKQSKETVEKRKKSIAIYRADHPQTNAGHRKTVYTDSKASFESAKDAAKFFNVHPSTVTKAIKRGGKVHGVKVWYAV